MERQYFLMQGKIIKGSGNMTFPLPFLSLKRHGNQILFCSVYLLSLQLILSYLTVCWSSIYTAWLVQLSFLASKWFHIFKLLSNLHFLGLAFFYSGDVFGTVLPTLIKTLYPNRIVISIVWLTGPGSTVNFFQTNMDIDWRVIWEKIHSCHW